MTSRPSRSPSIRPTASGPRPSSPAIHGGTLAPSPAKAPASRRRAGTRLGRYALPVSRPRRGAALQRRVSFHETYPAVAQSVSAIRAALTQFLDAHRVGRETIESVKLAASEAATNVVIHAYRDRDTSGEIEVASWIGNEHVHIVIADHGSGLSARLDSPGLGLGLGLAIVARVTDGLDLLRQENGFEIRMRFSLAAGEH